MKLYASQSAPKSYNSNFNRFTVVPDLRGIFQPNRFYSSMSLVKLGGFSQHNSSPNSSSLINSH